MKHSLWALGLGAALALVGCATEDQGTGDAGDDAPSGMDATMDVQPPRDSGTDRTTPPDSGMDAGMDATPTDAGDGGVTDGGDAGDAGDGGLAPPGSPCNVPNSIEDEACGLCGKHYRACLPGGDGGYVWGAWGFCQNEVQGGCDPKVMYPDIDCNLCGKRKAVCLSNCTFDLTQQCQQPMNACIPGDTTYVLGLSCDAGGREAVCGNNCQFGNYGACLTTPSGMFIPTTVNAIATKEITMSGSLGRIGGIGSLTCPLSTSYPSTTMTSYTYTKVTNGTNQTAVISLWHARAIGSSTNVDTVLAYYRSASPPPDNDALARRTCSGTAEDGCATKFNYLVGNYQYESCTSGTGGFGGLMLGDAKGITLSPGESIWVYSARYSSTTTTDITLSLRTESLN